MKELETLNRRVDRHVGCNEEWLERHERACREAVRHGRAGVILLAGCLFDRAANMSNLLLAYEHVKRRSGGTAGPDGMIHRWFETTREKTDWLRAIQHDIRDGFYSHGEVRRCPVPKKDGGHRMISVQNLEDRVVHRAIAQVIQPLLDALFLPFSFGYRPGQSRFGLLALIERDVRRGADVVDVEDLRGAFDHVPLPRLLAVFKNYLPCDRLLQLVERAIMAERMCKGLPQGAALSPLLLNLYLHHVLDRKWQPPGNRVQLLRYADNIVVPCMSVGEAIFARAELVRLLRPAGFQLKTASDGQTTIRQLRRGMSANVLGFDILLAGERLTYRIPDASWDALNERAQRMAREDWPPLPSDYGRAVAEWLLAMGPAYADVRRDDVFEEIFHIGGEIGGVNLRPYQEPLQRVWRTASRQWQRILRNATDVVEPQDLSELRTSYAGG